MEHLDNHEVTRLSDVIDHPVNHENDCAVLVSKQGRPSVSISFDQTRWALQQHRNWLERALSHTFAVGREKTAKTKIRENHELPYQRGSIVIAFLSNNSVDFFLSVLAASDVSSPRSKHQQPSRNIIPVLLNTRWTVDEMYSVLKSSFSKDDKHGYHVHKTMILFGPYFRKQAEALAQQLSQDHEHICFKPLPEYSRAQRENAELNVVDQNETSMSKQPFEHPGALQRTKKPNRSLVQNYCSTIEAEDTALVLFTSGTTSGSKGVKLGHGALLIQAMAKLKEPCGFNSETRLWASSLPFFHVGGLVNILACWLAGGTLVLKDPTSTDERASGSFDPTHVWNTLLATSKSLTSKTCNTLVVVPAMIHMLQETYKPSAIFPFMQLVLIGGQSASQSALEFLRRCFPNVRLVQTYACTEAASSLTYHNVTTENENGSGETKKISGDCVGQPAEHVQLALLPMDGSLESGGGKPGRKPIDEPCTIGVVATRGPHLMNGYWKRSAVPSLDLSSRFDKNAWFITNDVGAWDEKGNLYFCGRVTDSIRTGGETVMALEVEQTIQKHPMVKEVAVFPIPHVRFGEAVACAIVFTEMHRSRDKTPLTLSSLRVWCKEHGLSGYKCPRSWIVLSSLPRNSLGKVLKNKLKQRAAATITIRSSL